MADSFFPGLRSASGVASRVSCSRLSKYGQVAAHLVVHQSWSVQVLLLDTLNRYPSSGESFPDNLPYKQFFLKSDFTTTP